MVLLIARSLINNESLLNIYLHYGEHVKGDSKMLAKHNVT